MKHCQITRERFAAGAISYVIIMLLLSAIPLKAQDVDSTDQLVVFAIKITGNFVTKSSLILREMGLKPGDVLSQEAIDRAQLRLENLGLFNRVLITSVSDKGRAVVRVEVNEPFYLYFFPLMNYRPNQADKSYFGGGVYHRNFRGRAEQLVIAGWGGNARGFYLVHTDPWFTFRGIAGFNWSIYYNDSELKGPNGNYYRIEEQKLGFHLVNRIAERDWISYGFEWEEQASEGDFYTFAPNQRDRLVVATFAVQKDRRDYRYYPSDGSLMRFTLQGNGMLNEQHVFFLEDIEFRRYLKYGRFIFAGRFFVESSQYELPYYRRFTLTNYLFRGNIEDFYGGWFMLASSAEIRTNLIPMRYFSMGWVPLAGRYLMNMKFSLESFVFLDYGYNEYRSNWLTRRPGQWAAGGGLQFQLPYVQTIHLACGWRAKDNIAQPAISLGLGVTF